MYIFWYKYIDLVIFVLIWINFETIYVLMIILRLNLFFYCCFSQIFIDFVLYFNFVR